MPSAVALVKQLLAILESDLDKKLARIDNYIEGKHDDPYMPETADAEYMLLAERAKTNCMPLLISSVAQQTYVDGFRRGHAADVAGNEGKVSPMAPEWDHWQFSHMDSRQTQIHRAALGFGHSFTVTLKDPTRENRAVTRGLSPLRTTAVFEDPASDIIPFAAITVDLWPAKGDAGEGRYWDSLYERKFRWKKGEDPRFIGKAKRHGASQCPVTRFAAQVDLEGRTTGIVEPMIPLNNRINQTVFDLLVAQTGGSFKTRWATGMAPPVKINPETGTPEIDPDTGRPIPLPFKQNARTMMFADKPDVKFGTLDETPLDGYIKAIEAAINNLAALSQTPPHHVLGQIANLSAEALEAAETALSRKVEEFRKVFGEAWERVFNIAAELDGHTSSAEDHHGEVVWRDMDGRSLAQNADALGKLREMLGIPGRGLWHRVPGTTQGELELWDKLYESEDSQLVLADALKRSSGSASRLGAGVP